MSRLFYHTMQDNAGNLLFDVTGTMRLAGTGTLATIYGDEALTVILPNPMTNHPSFGSFKCFLGAGDYDFYMAKSGYTFETLTGVQGHGTMAQQDASAVAITGGTVTGLTQLTALNLQVLDRGGANQVATSLELSYTGDATRYNIHAPGTAMNYLAGTLGVQTVPNVAVGIALSFPKNVADGMVIQPTVTDTAGGGNITFRNVAGAIVGRVVTDGASTSYATSSDARMKTAVHNLVGELAVIRALRPVRFRWLGDNSEGVGFLASEVAEHVQGVITGEADAVDEQGGIVPQQIDHSKLVPWLVGALQTLAGQVEALTERVTELEAGG